jgi:hypothetical protein
VIDVNAFGLVVMVLVLLGVVAMILLFERRRAREIERDLSARRRSASGSREPPPT